MSNFSLGDKPSGTETRYDIWVTGIPEGHLNVVIRPLRSEPRICGKNTDGFLPPFKRMLMTVPVGSK